MSEAKVYNNVASEENVQGTLLEQLVESRLENKMERGFNRILREMQVNNAELKSEIDKLDRKIDKVESKVDKLEIELKSEIKRVETDLNAKIDKVEAGLKGEIKLVNSKSNIALTLIVLILTAIVGLFFTNFF